MYRIAWRVLESVALLMGLAALLFALLSALPGDPVELLVASNPRVRADDVARLARLRGLDRPFPERFARWLVGASLPRRAPEVRPLAPVEVELGDGESSVVEIPLAPALRDPDGPLADGELAVIARRVAPQLADALAAVSDDEARRIVYARAPESAAALDEEVARARARGLVLRTLGGGRVDGTTLAVEVKAPARTRIWIVAEDPSGLMDVAAVDVVARLAPPPPLPRDPDDERQAAGSTEGGELPEPQAPPPSARRFVGPSANVLVDGLGPDGLALTELVEGDPPARFALRGGPGEIVGARYLVAPFAGRRVVELELEYDDGERVVGAFAVEGDPLPDPEKHQRGVLFALVGDREALGYSYAYKRPIADLLLGAPARCGDSRVDAAEQCDDGGRDDGDGCDAACVVEGGGVLARADRAVAAALRSVGRVGMTLTMTVPALLLALLLALVFGTLAAVRRGGAVDRAVLLSSTVFMSTPVFWLGLLVLAVLAERAHVIPSGGASTAGLDGGALALLLDRAHHALAPACVLAVVFAARFVRHVRGAVLEGLDADHVFLARMKGLSERRVIVRHVLGNALVPVLHATALALPSLFGGALLVETVFSWPGIGRLQYEAVLANDSYLAMVLFLIEAALVLAASLLADVLTVILDPRVSREAAW